MPFAGIRFATSLTIYKLSVFMLTANDRSDDIRIECIGS